MAKLAETQRAKVGKQKNIRKQRQGGQWSIAELIVDGRLGDAIQQLVGTMDVGRKPTLNVEVEKEGDEASAVEYECLAGYCVCCLFKEIRRDDN